MSGTLVGRVDVKGTVASGATASQEQFVTIKKFGDQMVAAGHWTQIASQHGTSGTGLNYHDEANPAGENAFVVWRVGPASTVGTYYVLLQYAHTNNFGASPGNPGAMNGAAGVDGVGIAVAAREDGGVAWNGGTANAGADAKGSAVWTAGASVLHVISRSCSPKATAGSFATNREDCHRVMEAPAGSTPQRIHCVGDADEFAILASQLDDGNYSCFAAGRYVARPGTTPTLPLYALAQYPGTPAFWSSGSSVVYGTGAGTGTTREGGILGRASDLVAAAGLALFRELADDDVIQPNNQPTTAELDAIVPYLVYNDVSRYGWVGTLSGAVIACALAASNHSVNAAADRAFLALATANVLRWSIPWKAGAAAPGTNTTRGGVTFP